MMKNRGTGCLLDICKVNSNSHPMHDTPQDMMPWKGCQASNVDRKFGAKHLAETVNGIGVTTIRRSKSSKTVTKLL